MPREYAQTFGFSKTALFCPLFFYLMFEVFTPLSFTLTASFPTNCSQIKHFSMLAIVYKYAQLDIQSADRIVERILKYETDEIK